MNVVLGGENEQKKNLKVHLKTHEVKDVYVKLPCTSCDKNYTDIRNLARHIKEKHSEPEVIIKPNVGFMKIDKEAPSKVETPTYSEQFHLFKCDVCE